MSSKTKKLNQLFDRWKESIPNYENNFVKDGIINEEMFLNRKHTPIRILYMMKEANQKEHSEEDYREWWKKEVKYTFSRRIAEWSYGILNGFKPPTSFNQDKQKLLSSLSQISFMNVKKEGGKAQSDQAEIKRIVQRDLKFIHKEVEIIDPDIIILGLSWTSVRNTIFGTNWIESGYDIEIKRFNNSKVIDFYHPSSRNAASATYCLLQQILNSDTFKQL